MFLLCVSFCWLLSLTSVESQNGVRPTKNGCPSDFSGSIKDLDYELTFDSVIKIQGQRVRVTNCVRNESPRSVKVRWTSGIDFPIAPRGTNGNGDLSSVAKVGPKIYLQTSNVQLYYGVNSKAVSTTPYTLVAPKVANINSTTAPTVFGQNTTWIDLIETTINFSIPLESSIKTTKFDVVEISFYSGIGKSKRPNQLTTALQFFWTAKVSRDGILVNNPEYKVNWKIPSIDRNPKDLINFNFLKPSNIKPEVPKSYFIDFDTGNNGILSDKPAFKALNFSSIDSDGVKLYNTEWSSPSDLLTIFKNKDSIIEPSLIVIRNKFNKLVARFNIDTFGFKTQ
jgi:hypothetical protein